MINKYDNILIKYDKTHTHTHMHGEQIQEHHFLRIKKTTSNDTGGGGMGRYWDILGLGGVYGGGHGGILQGGKK